MSHTYRRPRHVFLTGAPGVGKTTLVQVVRRRLGASVEAAGFVTVEQRDSDGERCGFRSFDVAEPSHEVQLASLDGEASEHCVGPFRVHLDEVVSFTHRALAAALRPAEPTEAARPTLVFLDEVGKMQLLSPSLEALFAQLTGDGGRCCFGTIPPAGLHALPFVEALRRRDDVAVVEVSRYIRTASACLIREDGLRMRQVSTASRGSLASSVCALLRAALFAPAVASQLEAKARLAERYVGELSARRTCVVPGLAWRFAGEHGSYTIRRSGPAAPRECSCPFFGERR